MKRKNVWIGTKNPKSLMEQKVDLGASTRIGEKRGQRKKIRLPIRGDQRTENSLGKGKERIVGRQKKAGE